MLPEDFPLGPEAIAQLMKAAGYNQTRLATRLGVSSGAVSKWVNGLSRPSHEHEAALRAIEPRPGKSKSWADFLAHVDATIAANRQPRPTPAEPAAPAAGTASTLTPEATAPTKLRVPVRRLARRLAEALRDQFDTLRSKLDEAAAKRETDKHEFISEVRAARRTLDGCTAEVAEEGSALSSAKAEAASAKAEQALGVAAWSGRPLPNGSTPAQAVQDLGAAFPGDEVATKLADALAQQGGPLDTLRAKLDALLSVFASRIAGKLDALASALVSMLGSLFATLDDVRRTLDTATGKLDAATGKLDAATGKLDAATGKLDVMDGKLDHMANAFATVAATVNHLDAKADVADYQRARDTRRIVRAVWCVGGLVSLVVVGVHCQPTPPTSEAEALVRAALTSVLNMGKKTEEHWIPKEPAPWQKRAKDCDRDLGEKPINGGCWVYIFDVQPPCGELFRYGDKCYRPVAADPTKPVGLFPDQR